MGLGRNRRGVIPAWGKNFTQPFAQCTYCPRQEGTLCKNLKAPGDILAFPEPLAGHPAPATLMSPGDGGRAGHPCARRESQPLLQPTEHIGSNS